MRSDNHRSEKVLPIRRHEDPYHRVRITANPANPRSIEIVEELLSRSDLARCDSSTEDGISTWSIIIAEDLLDLALEGMAVTLPLEDDLFESEEGHVYHVTPEECYRLGGIAEDIARCREPTAEEDLQSEVEQEIRSLIRSAIDRLPLTQSNREEDWPAKIESRAFDEVDLLTADEDAIQEAVRSAFDKITEEAGPREE